MGIESTAIDVDDSGKTPEVNKHLSGDLTINHPPRTIASWKEAKEVVHNFRRMTGPRALNLLTDDCRRHV